jgi:uncharacterized protein YjaG (DUF416 family)
MYAFDESTLNGQISRLPHLARVALAASVTNRQLLNYEAIGNSIGINQTALPSQTMAQLWSVLQNSKFDQAEWKSKLDIVMSLIPDESEQWTLKHALVEDALSSLAYTIRCLLSGDSQEAVWAFRRGYEACDQAAIRILKSDLSNGKSEDFILAHYFVQRELERQNRDVKLLLANSSDDALRKIRALSSEEELLTLEEIEFACS